MYKFTTVLFVLILLMGSAFSQTSPSVVKDLIVYSQALYYNHAGHVARTSDGKLFAVWTSEDTDSQIMFSQYDNSFQIWNPGVAISAAPSGLDAHKAGIASDNGGNLYCVWQQGESTTPVWAIYYSMYNGSSWSTPADLTGTTAINEEASISVSDQGRVFVAWNTDAESNGAEYVLCIYSDDGVNWSAPDTLSSADGVIGGTSTTSGRPFLAKGNSGKMVCTWHEEPDGYTNRESFVNQYDGSQWLGEQAVIDSTDAKNSMYPTIGVDSNDNIYLLYVSFTSPEKLLLKKKTWSDANWPAVPDTVVAADNQLTKPYLGIDSNDELYVVYRGEHVISGLELINYVASADGGLSWSNPVKLSRGDHDAGYVTLEPRVGSGGVDVLWRESYSENVDDGDSLTIVYGHIDLGAAALENLDLFVVNDFKLEQNFPNPFNPTTEISFYIAKAGKYELSVYNILGQKVRTLAAKEFINGRKSVSWNGQNDLGQSVGSGIYFYKLSGNGIELTKKMALIR